VEYLTERTDYRQSISSFTDTFIITDNGHLENGAFYEKLNKLSGEERLAINSIIDLILKSK